MRERISRPNGAVGIVASGCPGVCGACSRPCPNKPQNIEGKKIFVGNSAEKELQKPTLSAGFYILSPSFVRGSEPQIRTHQEKTCSICGESSSTCSHREISKN